MKFSDLIHTEPTTTIFGKRSGKWRATLAGSDMMAEGANADEAAIALRNELLRLALNQNKRKYFFSPSGKTVFVVYYSLGGWNYDIMRAGMISPSGCGFNPNFSFEQACKAASDHAAAYIEEN